MLRMEFQILIWAITGGIIVTVLGTLAAYYQKDTPTTKQIGRDFILGAAFTGFFYPLIPETFDDMKGVLTTNAATLVTAVKSSDPGVQIGPPNF